MTLPVVICWRPRAKRQPLECLCVGCGAIRPNFRLPVVWEAKGLLSILYAGFACHTGDNHAIVWHRVGME